ncbi:MAG: NADH-quinone oxidoreductase subunit C [Nitrospiraceae bacterium]|nr:MAG: NADH-quinone oxidoreductase subunit C [Nitrospiraceae bacterium]
MEQHELIEKVKVTCQDSIVRIEEMPNDDVLVEIKKEEILSVMDILKNDPELKFSISNHLGVDNGENYAVIYNLYSYPFKHKITVKACLDHEHPEIDSVESIFQGMNWFERETYDLLGIKFTGHSNLKRLLLPPDWEGHPLRKDYVYPDFYNQIDNRRPDLCD